METSDKPTKPVTFPQFVRKGPAKGARVVNRGGSNSEQPEETARRKEAMRLLGLDK